tara:strand:- start:1590 stop:1778 length:189 start_codon:yes stop_codon:yes gene_type:complete
MDHNRKKAKSIKKRVLTIPLQKSEHENNVLYNSLNTLETKKLVKKDKKIPIENIFIKTKSKK